MWIWLFNTSFVKLIVHGQWACHCLIRSIVIKIQTRIKPAKLQVIDLTGQTSEPISQIVWIWTLT